MTYPDGKYNAIECKKALSHDFESEKDFCDYLELNMSEFCEDCLGVELASYKREFVLLKGDRKKRGQKRIDFVINSKCGKTIAIECKDPYYESGDLANAIGQVLGYFCSFDLMQFRIDRFILVSTKIDSIVPMIVKKFNLPIEFMVLDKSKSITMILNEQNGH